MPRVYARVVWTRTLLSGTPPSHKTIKVMDAQIRNSVTLVCDYYGYDLLEQPGPAVTLDACADVCAGHELCTHFMFFPLGLLH